MMRPEPKSMTTRVEFKSKNGQTEHGELAEPSGNAKAPALIVIQEWWGVNDHIRSLVDRFAKEGFLALAPDLFHGKTTKDGVEAAKLLQDLDWGHAIEDVAGALAFLSSHTRYSGKVAITGFCMGGAVALASVAKLPALAAAVSFYGIPDPATDYSRVTAAIQGHFGKKDEHIRADYVLGLKSKLEKAGQGGGRSVEFHFYDAGHAFVNDTRPEVYNDEAAKLAWGRAVTFLKAHLAT
jgi:carboxymethylenebutenolidase